MKHFISLKYLTKKEILEFVSLAKKIKKESFRFRTALKNKYVGIFFQKPSLRTKTSFYLGTVKLGGEALYYSPEEVRLGEREKISDVARTVSSYFDAIVLRTWRHKDILEFAQSSTIPVINGLSDFLHPSQVLGDLLTLQEVKSKELNKLKVVYIGDGNNVCHSLMYAFSLLGASLYVVTPREFSPHQEVLSGVERLSKTSGAKIILTSSPKEAVQKADVLYTDVWTSMGKEKEREMRKKAFKNFQINDKLLKLARKDCVVMHCLPAHRGEEITDEVIEGRHSVVFLQAENRLYSAQAILLKLLTRI